MNDDQIIRDLKSMKDTSMPAAIINFLVDTKQSPLTQFEMIKYFKEAYPDIPLGVLQEASTAKAIVGGEGLEDGAVNRLLEPWFSAAQLS